MVKSESNYLLSRVPGAPKHNFSVDKVVVELDSLNGRERVELHFLSGKD